MSLQKVYRLPKQGSHHNLQLSEEPIPTPTKHEILIKIHGVSLNYRDLAVASGTYPFPISPNVVPCSDGAGEVVSIGDAVIDFKPGDRVVASFDLANFYGPRKSWETQMGTRVDGMLREYICLPAVSVTRIPEGTEGSWVEWASLVCTGVTVWNALFGGVQLKPGQTVLFQGTGGVSITGLLIAKAAGAVTIITSSSDSKLSFVKKRYGVDHTINYKSTPDWAAEVLKLTSNLGVNYILENGGSGTIAQSLKAITQGGTIAAIGFLSKAKQEDMPDVTGLVMGKGAILRGINVGPKEMLDDVVSFVSRKGIRMPVDRTFKFKKEEVLRAFDYLEKGGHVGKVCISLE